MAKKLPKKPGRSSSAAGESCVIYARFSSHSQRDESIEQQVEQCSAYAAALGIKVLKIYDDHAVSGRSDSRPQFQRMMKDAETGSFAYVIAWKSNRMGRNMLQAMLNEAKLNELGVRCLYVEEDFDDSAAGRFALRNMMNVNEFYSEAMAEDIRRGLRDSASKCKVIGPLPYGYKKADDGRYAIDPARAQIVREIFERIASHEMYQDISRDLNARGIKTSSGGVWNKGSFHRMLSNQKYIGIYKYQDIEIHEGVPRIISDDLWYRAQEVAKMRSTSRGHGRRGGREEYLLTGKLHCGECGDMMVGISGTSKSGALHAYYQCKGKKESGCTKKNVRRDKIETAIAQAIRDYVLTDDVIKWMADSVVNYSMNQPDDDTAILKDELACTEKSISNIMKAIEMGVITETTTARLKELEGIKKDINRRINAQESMHVEVTYEDVVAFLYLFKDKDIHDKAFQKTLFDSFLVSVYVYDDTLKIVFGYTGDKNYVDVPISLDDLDSIGTTEDAQCSYRFPSAPPNESQTNTAKIYMIESLFVLVCRCS